MIKKIKIISKLVHVHRFAGFDFVFVSGENIIEVYGCICGVVNCFSVGGINEIIECGYVVVNLSVCRVPDVFLSGYLFAEVFQNNPVVLVVIFVAVTP